MHTKYVFGCNYLLKGGKPTKAHYTLLLLYASSPSAASLQPHISLWSDLSKNYNQLLACAVEGGQKKNKLLLQHFVEQTQAKRLVFMEKYAFKHVYELRKLKLYAAVNPKIFHFY